MVTHGGSSLLIKPGQPLQLSVDGAQRRVLQDQVNAGGVLEVAVEP